MQHALRIVRSLRTWQLIILAFVMTFLSVLALRANSLEAAKYFEAVKQADETGQGINDAMNNLQDFVSHHMNTDLERVTLSSTYERDYEKAVQNFQNSGDISGTDEKAAIAQCAYLQKPGVIYYQQYSHCVEDILKTTPSAANPDATVKAPLKELYEFHFVSPGWSPDTAGLTTAIAALLWLVLVIKLLVQTILVFIVRHHRG